MTRIEMAQKLLREIRKSKEQINEHVMAGGCHQMEDYIASLAKLRAFQAVEDYIIELNARDVEE